MGKQNYLGIFSAISAIIGLIFSLKCQSMAYLGPDGGMTIHWFWVGVALAYVFTALAIVCLFILRKNPIKKTSLQRSILLISPFFIVITLFWTTFLSIAWQSGF